MKPVKNSIQSQGVMVGQVWRAILGNGRLVSNSYVAVVEIDTERTFQNPTGQCRIGYEYIRGYQGEGIYYRFLNDFLKSAELTQERR